MVDRNLLNIQANLYIFFIVNWGYIVMQDLLQLKEKRL